MGSVSAYLPGGTVISYNRTESSDPSAFESHCHSCYEILCVLEGSGYYIVEGVKYPLRPNSLMVFRPNEFHYVCPEEKKPYERYVINFFGSFLNETTSTKVFFNHSDRSAGKGLYFSGEDLNSSVLDSLEIAKRSLLEFQKKAMSEEVFSCLILGIISQILLLLSCRISGDVPQKDCGTVAKMISFINEHLTEKVTLEELSKQFLISDSYLCRIFRNATGLTVHDYISVKRITLAKQMLREGVPATEVAYRIGYPDYSTFFRSYKKITGKSPVQER